MPEPDLGTTQPLLGETPQPGPRPPANPVFGRPGPDGTLGRLGHYRVIKKLGSGGMGAVYLGHDEGLDRKVALKVLLAEAAADPASRERFVREARAAAAVRNDHVVTIYQVGEDRGVPFIAMEYLTGYPLDVYLARKGRLTVPQALRIGREAAEGLAAAHELGLVHRDIKPANLFLVAPGGRVKILDFGIARQVAEALPALTDTGLVVGTPGFMSPEQARGKPLDHRTDLFALGCVLYQLTTGRQPFEGEDVLAVLTALAVDDPPPVRSLNPDVPAGFETIIHRLLAKDPGARPVSAAALAGELRALAASPEQPGGGSAPHVVYVPVAVAADEPNVFAGIATAAIAAAPTTLERPAARPKPGGRGLVWLWVAVASVVAAGLAVGTVLAVRKSPPKDPDPPAEVKPAAKPAAKPGPTPDPPPVQPLPADPFDPDGKLSRDFSQALGRLMDNAPLSDEDAAILDGRLGALGMRIGFTPVNDANFEKLSRFAWVARMEELDIVAPNLTPAGFAHVVRFTGLVRLGVIDSRVNDDCLEPLTKLPRLQELSLNGTRITDKAAARLAALRGVRLLDVGRTAFGDEGLKGLAPMTGLTHLDVRGTPVTDAGLAHLADRKLARLDVRNTKVTAAGVAKFKAANPGCAVESDPDTP